MNEIIITYLIEKYRKVDKKFRIETNEKVKILPITYLILKMF